MEYKYAGEPATPPATSSVNILRAEFSHTQTKKIRRNDFSDGNDSAQSGRTGPIGAARQRKTPPSHKEAKSALLCLSGKSEMLAKNVAMLIMDDFTPKGERVPGYRQVQALPVEGHRWLKFSNV